MRDFTAMTGSLELATALRAPSTSQRVVDRQVWHCPLRVAPGDRPLTDAEWAAVALDVMDRTGIARPDDPGGCRWVAVRHDEHSVHLVAVLARQDGRAVRLPHDYRRVREACLAAEQRYGLTVTAPADRTAAGHVTRAEAEKTRRTLGEQAVPDRAWLCRQVQLTATWAGSADEFLNGLRGNGLQVRKRRDSDGALSGYAVARPQALAATDPKGPAVFFGGGKLAPDLSLPKLQARWDSDSHEEGSPAAPAVESGLLAQALEASAGLVRAEVREPAGRYATAAADVASAQSDLLAAVAWAVEGRAGGPVTRAAAVYPRAGRQPGGGAPAPSRAGTVPRARARQSLRVAARGGTSPDAARLLVQVLDLVDAVAELRRAQGQLAQAAAAASAATELRRRLAVPATARPASRTAAASTSPVTPARRAVRPVDASRPRGRSL